VRRLAPGVPIVIPAMRDGIAQGFTTSLARPDGNITGSAVFYAELSGKRLELLKEAVPRLQRAGAVFNAALNANPPQGIAVMTAAGEALGVRVVSMPVAMPGGVDAAFAAAVREGIQGVAALSDTATISYRASLCDAALGHRLPAMYSNRSYLRGGGLMSYGPDLEAVYHRAANFVDRLLKGAQVADLPIEQVTSFQDDAEPQSCASARPALPAVAAAARRRGDRMLAPGPACLRWVALLTGVPRLLIGEIARGQF